MAAMQSSSGAGEGVLGGERILDAQAAQAGPFGDLARQTVIGVDTAEHPAAAMNEHDRGRRGGCAGIVEPDFGAAARHIDRSFLDMRQRRTAGVEIERQAGVDPAKFRRRKLGRGRQALQAREDQSKDEPQLRIERTPGRLELREEGRGRGIGRRSNGPLRQGGGIPDGGQCGSAGADCLYDFAT
jgi:hypothetical protein